MAEIHYFDVHIAELYGVNCAVILQNIYHWIKKNEANDKNFHDGYYWTYNSTKAFKNMFPYLSQKQIETALKKLRDEGIITTGNYNEYKYDRTLWYAIIEKGMSILTTGKMEITKKGNGFDTEGKSISPVGKMEITKKGNGFDTEGKPIPNINTNINTDLKTTDNKPNIKLKDAIKKIVEYLNEKAETRYRPETDNTVKLIKKLMSGDNPFTVEDFKTVIDKKCKEWKGTEFEKYLRPSTLFGNKFENYLNQKENASNGQNTGNNGSTNGEGWNIDPKYTL